VWEKFRQNRVYRFWEIGVWNFWGRGTFWVSTTCGAPWRKLLTPSPRGRRTVKNAVDRLSISTSGPELWRFEFWLWGALGPQISGKPLDKFSPKISHGQTVWRSLSYGKNQKSPRCSSCKISLKIEKITQGRSSSGRTRWQVWPPKSAKLVVAVYRPLQIMTVLYMCCVQ